MSEFSGIYDPRDLRVAALKYNSEADSAPIVVAAGAGHVASRILEIADECGISVYHDDSAATLLSRLSLGASIPPELYQVVVDIYLAVMAVADHKEPLGNVLPSKVPPQPEEGEGPGIAEDTPWEGSV